MEYLSWLGQDVSREYIRGFDGSFMVPNQADNMETICNKCTAKKIYNVIQKTYFLSWVIW